MNAAASEIKAWLGASKLDLLVNNAGNSYGWWNAESWSESRAVNYSGPVLLTTALIQHFAHGASVVVVGSSLGNFELLSPKYRRLLARAQNTADLDKVAGLSEDVLTSESTCMGPYGFSKALVRRAAEVLAADGRLKPKGVRVNVTCPGWVCTDMGGAQAPVEVAEGAQHILQDALDPESSVTGCYACFCYKNYDAEHLRSWDEKHGKREGDERCGSDLCGSHPEPEAQRGGAKRRSRKQREPTRKRKKDG